MINKCLSCEKNKTTKENICTVECVTLSMCVCLRWCEREPACITCPVGVGVRFAYDTACENANAIDAVLPCDGQKKCISTVTLNWV